MSDYAGGNADRDAFFAALGRIFQEFRDVSKGYAILDFARVAAMVGADAENQRQLAGLRMEESSLTSTVCPA
jgi:hypothetical protein